MLRGLRVPSSYLPSGPEEGTATYNDGRVGTAFIQEFRFTKFCERLQALVCEDLDREFKMFLKHRGVIIESSLFDLKFNTPAINAVLINTVALLFLFFVGRFIFQEEYRLNHIVGFFMITFGIVLLITDVQYLDWTSFSLPF